MQNIKFAICSQCKDPKMILSAQQQILPEKLCLTCQKNEPELLYKGFPICKGCYDKQRLLKGNFKRATSNFTAGNPNSAHMPTSSTPSIQSGSLKGSLVSTSLKTIRQSQTILTKKIEKLIKDCRANPKQIAAIKKYALGYYIPGESSRITWKVFMEKCQKKNQILIFVSMKDRIIGGFWNEHIDKSNNFIDYESGMFDFSEQRGLEFHFLNDSKIVYKDKVLYLGDPANLRINFETFKLNCDLVGNEDIEMPTFFMFKL